MLKRLLIILLVLTLMAAGLFFALNTTVVTKWLVASVIKKELKGYTLEEFSIGRQQFAWPDRLVLSNIRCRLKSKNDFYQIVIRQIECSGRAPSQIFIEEAALESSSIVAKPGEVRGNVYFQGLRLDHFDGEAKIPELEVHRFHLANVSSQLEGTTKKMTLRNLKADTYQGKLSGQISLDWQKNLPYSMDIHFDNVDLSPMKDVNPSIGQVEGVVSGWISVQGNTRNFHTLDLKANVTKDGRIDASLLQFVAPYIPGTKEAALLQDMMKRGEKIPVEVATMQITSVEKHKLSGFVKLLIGKLNLDLNLPVDILYDGNLFSLLRWYQRINQ
jgi:hypothetical protein